MSNPLSLISLAAAAGGGAVDGVGARQMVAAGVTMLQRCAPLVRELAHGRAVVLLPDSAAYLAALAACEGRAAVLLNPAGAKEEATRATQEAGARVVFTLGRYAGAVERGAAVVLLDELPGRVEFVNGGERRWVDVGSHFGLSIEGMEESEGSEEEAIVARSSAGDQLEGFTHRELLDAARGVARVAQLGQADEVLALLPFHEARGLVSSLLAPLLAGARVRTLPRAGGAKAALDMLDRGESSVAVGDAASLATITGALKGSGRKLEAPSLRLAVSVGGAVPAAVREVWERATGVELREAALAHTL